RPRAAAAGGKSARRAPGGRGAQPAAAADPAAFVRRLLGAGDRHRTEAVAGPRQRREIQGTPQAPPAAPPVVKSHARRVPTGTRLHYPARVPATRLEQVD